MSYLVPPTTPEWLEKAARDAACELSDACEPGGVDGHHTVACTVRARVILKHMAAAMALARIDPNRPTVPITTLAGDNGEARR